MPSGHSVQFELFSSIVTHLSKVFKVSIASIFFSKDKRKRFADSGVQSISISNEPPHLCRLLHILNKDNEAMFWLESWLREGFFRSNSKEFENLSQGIHFDYVVNATNTVPVRADIWWAQGPPLLTTLREISDDNVVANMAAKLGSSLIRKLDDRLRNEIIMRTKRVIANSKYSAELYNSMGVNVDGVIFNTKDFSQFKSSTSNPSRDFVLTYIGKETDMKPIVKVAAQGVRIVGFGSKLPVGARKDIISAQIDFRGEVTDSELIDLYSNALFTMFPFTNEPFGYVPLESMACGTPVLTYKKQGPAETVIDGRTGWLVKTQNEIVKRALSIWKAGRTDIEKRSCVDRVSEFSPANTARQFELLLNGS